MTQPETTAAGMIRELRRSLGQTQDEFGDSVGLSRFTVNQTERGKRYLSAESAVRIEKVTGLSADRLVTATAMDQLREARQRMARVGWE